MPFLVMLAAEPFHFDGLGIVEVMGVKLAYLASGLLTCLRTDERSCLQRLPHELVCMSLFGMALPVSEYGSPINLFSTFAPRSFSATSPLFGDIGPISAPGLPPVAFSVRVPCLALSFALAGVAVLCITLAAVLVLTPLRELIPRRHGSADTARFGCMVVFYVVVKTCVGIRRAIGGTFHSNLRCF